MIKLRDQIKLSMQELIETQDGLIFGQNLTDVGWVAGTIPELPNSKNYVELPISDIAGPGIAVGSAISGRPTVYISRYQGYLWFNMAPFATYAAPARVVFDQQCKLLIRSIADDGSLGPIAAGSHFSIATHVQDLKIVSPVSPQEWSDVWKYFNQSSEPIFVAEHRSTYDNVSKIEDYKTICDVVVLSIGGTSQLIPEISSNLNKSGISNSYANVLWIKPFNLASDLLSIIKNAKLCVILDPEDTGFGISNSIKNELGKKMSTEIITIGSKVGFPGYSKNLSSKYVDIKTVVDLIQRNLNNVS